MLSAGLIEEVRALLAKGYAWDLKPLRSVGYAEVVRGGVDGGAVAGAAERDVGLSGRECSVPQVNLDCIQGLTLRFVNRRGPGEPTHRWHAVDYRARGGWMWW